MKAYAETQNIISEVEIMEVDCCNASKDKLQQQQQQQIAKLLMSWYIAILMQFDWHCQTYSPPSPRLIFGKCKNLEKGNIPNNNTNNKKYQ
jgi:hypothetical protein